MLMFFSSAILITTLLLFLLIKGFSHSSYEMLISTIIFFGVWYIADAVSNKK